MKSKYVIGAQSLIILFVMSSCALQPRQNEQQFGQGMLIPTPLSVYEDRRVINHTTNHNIYNWHDTPTLAVPPVVPASTPPAIVAPPVIRRIKVGCDAFIMPVLSDAAALTGAMLAKMAPKSPSELNTILLANMEQNQKISKDNKERLDEAFKKHIQSCK